MGLFSKLTKAGIVKVAVDQARKPENQRKMKNLVNKAKNRRTNPGSS
jgi:hypothetical protein